MNSSSAISVMVKALELVPVPEGVVTEMVPVVAPAGTVAVIWVSELIVNEALVPLNFTLVAPVNEAPLITTIAPGAPLVGLKLVILGMTEKLAALVALPAEFTTVILPVVAPAGTTALMDVEETGVTVEEETPLNLTSVTVSSLLPLMVTSVPIGPLSGVKLLMASGVHVSTRSKSPLAFEMENKPVPSGLPKADVSRLKNAGSKPRMPVVVLAMRQE